MDRLKNQVALITGAGSGIGKETALLFLAEGASVVAVDLHGDTVAAIPGVHAVQADVSKAADCERMVAEAEAKYGKLTVMFNNAGISHADDDDAMNTTEAVWDLTFAVNVKGVFLGCKYGIPALRRAGGGSIINTASFVALLGAATPQLAYTASKGAVLSMSRELAAIHARENIRVNALCPGFLDTPMTDHSVAVIARKTGKTPDQARAALAALNPQNRLIAPDEVTAAALWLCGPGSQGINGQAIAIAGGEV